MQSRVYFPSERTCPRHVLAGCRAVDPAAEILYAGHGRWLLGVVRFSWPAYQQAYHTMARLEEGGTKLPQYGPDAVEGRELTLRGRANAEKRAFHRLCLQGYRHIAVYNVTGELTSTIVHDFQYRDFELRVFADWGLDLVLQQAMNEGDQRKLAKIAKMRDALRTHGTGVYRYLGGQRHIPTIGSKGAA